VPLGIELHDPTIRRYGLTIVLACAVTAYSGPPDPVTRLLTSWRFGIYLVHPLVIREYAALLGDRGGPWPRASSTPGGGGASSDPAHRINLNC
jgi:hypothetical protein